LAILKPVVFALRTLATLTFVTVGVVLVVALLPHFEGAGSYPWVSRVVEVDAAIISRVRSVVPTQLGRMDLARAFLALAVLALAATFDFGANRLHVVVSKKRRRRRRDWFKSLVGARKAKRAASKVERAQARSDERKSREELVKLMVEAKRELDAMTRDVAFLALDVVESTNMKLGEDKAFIEHDFREFKKMVDAVTVDQGMLKAAWTPDGAMICFDSLARAVRAAQAMLRQLPDFNAKTRMMGTPFKVRCGVNAGRVQYDDATPMEAMSDNAIDIAGHMQKYAAPDTIFVATDLIERSGVSTGFTSADTEVDGYAVSVWRGPAAHLY
jgi:hypothetical protein